MVLNRRRQISRLTIINAIDIQALNALKIHVNHAIVSLMTMWSSGVLPSLSHSWRDSRLTFLTMPGASMSSEGCGWMSLWWYSSDKTGRREKRLECFQAASLFFPPALIRHRRACIKRQWTCNGCGRENKTACKLFRECHKCFPPCMQYASVQ